MTFNHSSHFLFNYLSGLSVSYLEASLCQNIAVALSAFSFTSPRTQARFPLIFICTAYTGLSYILTAINLYIYRAAAIDSFGYDGACTHCPLQEFVTGMDRLELSAEQLIGLEEHLSMGGKSKDRDQISTWSMRIGGILQMNQHEQNKFGIFIGKTSTISCTDIVTRRVFGNFGIMLVGQITRRLDAEI